MTDVPVDIVDELGAIGESEMYEAPASTHATIGRALRRSPACALPLTVQSAT